MASLFGLAISGRGQTLTQSACPPPVEIDGSDRIPAFADMMQRNSPDGKNLVFVNNQGDGGAYFVNMQTLTRKQIVVAGGLPSERDISWQYLTSCPYDPDLISLMVVSFVDSDSSGHASTYVQNLFTYRFSTGAFQLITPKILGPFGSGQIAGGWYSGSTPGNDTFTIGYGSTKGNFHGLYVPKTQSLIATPLVFSKTVLATSRDGLHTIYQDSTIRYFLDSSRIEFPFPIIGVNWASFSPNQKLIALGVQPTDGFEHVCIYGFIDPTKPIDTINFQDLYCTYSFKGIYPEFITDSTIAVSMHKDGDESSPLWEITIDGRIVRQLTFLPELAVNTSIEPSFTISQNSDHLKISGEQQATSCRIFSLLGTELLSQRGIGTLDIDLSHIPAGIYFAVVETGERREVRKIAVLH